MSLKDSVNYVFGNKQRVIGAAEDIFNVRAPAPNIIVGSPRSLRIPDLAYVPENALEGMYNGTFKLILINPLSIEQNSCGMKRMGYSLNPKYEALRILAKEYGQYLYWFLHNWDVYRQISEYSGNKTLAASLSEAVGYATYFKVAKRLGHPDDYMFIHEAQARHGLLPRADNIDQSKAAAGHYFGREWLSELSDSEFRNFVRHDLKEVWDKISLLLKENKRRKPVADLYKDVWSSLT